MEKKKGKIHLLLVVLLITATVCSVPTTIIAVQANSVVTRFRLLAVERYFDHTRMREGEDLILTLLGYPNWDNSTADYESYIHLLSAIDNPANLSASVQPYYQGNSTKANLQYEIEHFLAQAGDEEIVILYYVGHSGTCYMSLDYTVSEAELDSWMSAIDPDAYVNMILDTCHSGCWIHDGAGPNELDHADNVLVACHQDQSAWCWGCHTAFTDEGLLASFGALSTDSNLDGWVSLSEAFDWARPVTIAYAAGKNKTQEPESWYGVCTGNVPIVQRDPTEPFPDFAPPTTYLFISIPKYWHFDTYVTSASNFTLWPDDSLCPPSSGTDFTQYRIDGGLWITYTSPFQLSAALLDGPHTVYFYSQDNAGNVEPTNSMMVILDNTPPTTTLSIGSPQYADGTDLFVNSSTPFTLTASDGAGSGVDDIEYRINGGSWTTYTGPFTLSGPDGTYVIEYNSTDNLGNVESTHSATVILDNTPPTVEVITPADGLYVYGQITIQITATDAGSGVDDVEYSLDNSTWVSTTYNAGTGYYEADWDTSLSTDGDYTVYARAFDHLGNEGHDPNPPTVTIVHLDLSTSFSDSDSNPIDDFNAVFSAQKPPLYKVSTNPGTIYQNITITNTGTTVTLPSLDLNASIPIEADFLGAGEKAFKTQGAKYVHIYLNGEDVTPKGKWQPTLSALATGQDLAPGDTITILIHYEYAFKGNRYNAADVMPWGGEDYDFETIITNALGPSWTGTLSALPVIV